MIHPPKSHQAATADAARPDAGNLSLARALRRSALACGAALWLAGCVSDGTTGGAAPAKAVAEPPAKSATKATEPRPSAPAQTGARTASEQLAVADVGDINVGPRLGTTDFQAPGVSAAQPTGTLVGQKVEQLRADLARLQARMADHNVQMQARRATARQGAGGYHSLVAEINARLQVGTTRGNPELIAQWNQAQAELNRVGESLTSLNTLANEAASTSALAAFLLESTHATFELRGAVEEDHRQLAVLEDEVNKTVVVIDRLLNELTEDIARTQKYFTTERANLTAMQVAIDKGEYMGGSLAGLAYGVPPPAPSGGAATLVGQRQPLVVIRFNQPNVEYEQALFTAIGRALERKPNAGFDLVALAPSTGTPAEISLATNRSRRNAEGVLRSLTNMGLPADRVTLTALSSGNVQGAEVHVYVR